MSTGLSTASSNVQSLMTLVGELQVVDACRSQSQVKSINRNMKLLQHFLSAIC